MVLLTVVGTSVIAVVILCAAICIAADVGVWLVVRSFLAHGRTEERLRQYEKQMERQMEHYEALRTSEQTARIFRHDYRNHISAVGIMLDAGEYARAKEYVDRLSAAEAEGTLKQHCKIPEVDAVLLFFSGLCRKRDIALTIDIQLPEAVAVEPIHLCGILSNLFENAIEASPAKGGEIRLAMYIRIGVLHIIMHNRTDTPPVMQKGERPKTTKPGGGLGLVSVEQTAALYHGTVTYRAEPSAFEVATALAVCLPLSSVH